MTDTAPHPSDQIPEPHLHFVYAAALRQTRDPHLAADITQAVFVLLARRIHQGRPPKETHMAGWLLNVTRFAVKESHRAATRRAYHEKKSAELRPESTPSSDATADTGPIASHLDAALLALPATDRELLIRRYLQSEPVNELAATLRIPPNTAAKRITRALDRLRTLHHHRGILAPAALLTAQSLIRTPPAVAAQILTAPATTPLAKALITKLLLLKLQAALAIAALLVATFFSTLLVYQRILKSPPSTSLAVAVAAPPNAPTHSASQPTPEQLRARRLLFTLRNSLVFVKADETYSTVRELVSIGKSAVPEICAELDRSTHDDPRRFLAFTLRIIGDPRAVPALLRALPKTNLLASDCGDRLHDRDLYQFVADHHISYFAAVEPYPTITIPRADREILAALTEITHHSASKAKFYSKESRRSADLILWQDWWDDDASEFLTQQELDAANLTPPDDIDPLLAAAGPLFPSGSALHLGPIHQLLLSPQGLFDKPAYIHFATGQTFTPFENVSKHDTTNFAFTEWFREAGIDAFTSSYFLESTTQPANSTPFHGLDGHDLHTWSIDNARWNTLDAELRSPQPLDLGNFGPRRDFVPLDLATGEQRRWLYPATFLFLTSDHTRGILQLLESSNSPPGIKFRYRLIESPATSATTLQSSPSQTARANLPTNLHFTPEKTVTLHAAARNTPCIFNLDTGQLITPTMEVTQPDHPEFLNNDLYPWLTAQHADLIALPPSAIPLPGADTIDMAVFPLTTAAWESLSPPELLSITSRDSLKRWAAVYADSEHQSPATWAFKTRSGATGLLQITNTTPTTLTLHYKLLTPTP